MAEKNSSATQKNGKNARRDRPRRRPPGRGRGPRQVDVPDNHLIVGQIVGPHGIRGEVRVALYTDFPQERFAPGQTLYLGQALTKIAVNSARMHKDKMLVGFEEVTDRTQAEELRDGWLFVPEDDALDLDADTYYVHDLVGLAVYTTEDRLLGTLQDVLFTGANDVYVVAPASGVNKGKEILLPAVAQVVQSVDLTSKRLVVELMPGLLEE